MGASPFYREAAAELGRTIAAKGWSLVYGGGQVGLMGVVANTVLEEGGEVTGVIPHFLNTREVAHDGVTHLKLVETMHERKALMEKLSDGFVALPGGFGTYEELMEIITWGQLGLHCKPIGVLDLQGFYQPLLAQVDKGVESGFIRPEFRSLLVSGRSVDELVTALQEFQPGEFERFLDRARS
jgi:uncharacterized protein (TIGR00730 family)